MARLRFAQQSETRWRISMPYYEEIQRILIAAISAEVITLITVVAVKSFSAE